MRQLDGEERTLIELARDAHDPSDEDRARVRSALAARLGVVAGLGAAASFGTSANAAAAAGAGGSFGAGTAGGAAAAGTLAAKLIGAAVVVAAAVGVPAVAVHRARHARIVAVSAPARGSASRQATPMTAPVTAPVTASVAAPPEEGPSAGTEAKSQVARSPERSTRGEEIVARPSEGPARHARPTEPPGKPDLPNRSASPTLPTLADEARMVHDGVVALRAGDAEGALALFDRHSVLFPRGALAEECDAERALALAELGREDEAHAAAEEFLRAHPTSPLSARLRERLHELDLRRNGSPTGSADIRPTK